MTNGPSSLPSLHHHYFFHSSHHHITTSNMRLTQQHRPWSLLVPFLLLLSSSTQACERACQVNVSHAFADKYQLLSAHYFTLLDTRIQASFLYGLPPTPTLMTQQEANHTLRRLSSAVTRAQTSWDLSLFRTIFDTIFVDEPKFKGDCNEPQRVVQPPPGVNWTMSDCHSMNYICGKPPSICHFMPMIKTRIVRKLKEQLAGKLNGGQDADVYVNFLGPALQTILQSQPMLREYTARLHGNLNQILEWVQADVEVGFAEEEREWQRQWDLEIKTLLLSYP